MIALGENGGAPIMAEAIFVPVQGNAAVTSLANAIQNQWCGAGVVVTTMGQNQLGALNGAASSLYIVGHGNWGSGVGTSQHHYGGGRLAQILVNEGLQPAQVALDIYVVACNSGVAMQRLGPLAGRRRAYVARLADALAALGFTNVTVHGYAGFISTALSSTLKLNRWTLNPSATHAHRVNLSGPNNREVVYSVMGGVAQKVSGQDWQGTSSVTSTRIA
jgi:hypothetical protein